MTTELITINEEALIVCPATGDGMACAVILNRHLGHVFNTIFLPENSVADIFDYPVVQEQKGNRRVHIAGFAFQEGALHIKEFKTPQYLTWYSHHFWAQNSLDFIKKRHWEIQVDWNYSATSALLLDLLKIENRFTKKCVDSLSQSAMPAEPEFKNWFYASLASRTDLYGLRKLLEPLFNAKTRDVNGPINVDLIEEGRNFYESLREMILTSHQHVFKIGHNDIEVCVLPIPGSLAPFLRIIASLAIEILHCPLVIAIIDGTNQVVIVRDGQHKGLWAIQFIAEALEVKMGSSIVMLYDKNTIVIATGEIDAVSVVELIRKTLEEELTGQGNLKIN